MRYVTSFERIGIQKGKQQGMIETSREAILDVLRVRFGQAPDTVATTIQALDNHAVLKDLLRQAAVVETLAGFEDALTQYDMTTVPNMAES
jgi:hypothetical protein